MQLLAVCNKRGRFTQWCSINIQEGKITQILKPIVQELYHYYYKKIIAEVCIVRFPVSKNSVLHFVRANDKLLSVCCWLMACTQTCVTLAPIKRCAHLGSVLMLLESAIIRACHWSLSSKKAHCNLNSDRLQKEKRNVLCFKPLTHHAPWSGKNGSTLSLDTMRNRDFYKVEPGWPDPKFRM